MVVRYLWDTTHKQEAWIVDSTPTSFRVLLTKTSSKGIDCLNWFDDTADWKDGSTPFNRRFTWLVNEKA